MDSYGLIGKNIDYSFSREFFTKKFSSESIQATYKNFDLEEISQLKCLLQNEKDLKGLNVTIPYKEKIMPFLDEIDPDAQKIGAVNTIKITDGKLIGHNTDVFGFVRSIFPLLGKHYQKALILGTGGASKAVVHGLRSFGIEPMSVSRKPKKNSCTYEELSEEIIEQHLVIINCTPLGTFPAINECPNIPYQFIGKRHLLYDLIYNPPLTKFLAKGKRQGAQICNGQKMLEFQAEKAWDIWTSK